MKKNIGSVVVSKICTQQILNFSREVFVVFLFTSCVVVYLMLFLLIDLQYMSQGRIKTIGVVKRVAAKFAYITTDYGVVFCPLAAAVPPEENVPYLNERYTINDKVHVIAVKQEGKNGCDFRATKVV